MADFADVAGRKPDVEDVHTVRVERGVRVPMRDGVTLEADVYRPAFDGELPAVVMRVPYDKRVWQAQGVPEPSYLAARGYLVVIQDVRGVFGSEGVYSSPAQEIADGADTIAWASQLPGSTGDVATFGPSYLAQVQWAAALASPPALRAMIPMVSPNDSLFDGFVFRGGAIEMSRIGWGTGPVGINSIARRTDINAAEKEELVAEMDERQESGHYIRTRPLGALANERTPVADAVEIWSRPFAELADEPTMTRGRYGEIHAAAFLIAGWYDSFLGSTLAQFQGLQDAATSNPLHLLVGPWSHMEAGRMLGDVDFGASAAHDDMGEELSLIDQHIRWLKATTDGRPEALEGVAPVRLFVMGENRWRSFRPLPPHELSARTAPERRREPGDEPRNRGRLPGVSLRSERSGANGRRRHADVRPGSWPL